MMARTNKLTTAAWLRKKRRRASAQRLRPWMLRLRSSSRPDSGGKVGRIGSSVAISLYLMRMRGSI